MGALIEELYAPQIAEMLNAPTWFDGSVLLDRSRRTRRQRLAAPFVEARRRVVLAARALAGADLVESEW